MKYRITCNERVRYDQIVTLNDKESERLERLWVKAQSGGPSDDDNLREFVDDMIDRRDAEDGDGLDDIEIARVEQEQEG